MMSVAPGWWLSARGGNCGRWSAWSSNRGSSAPPGDSWNGTHANSTASWPPVVAAAGKTQPMPRTLVVFGGCPHQLDGLAQPLGQERQDRVWLHLRWAAQQAGFSGRLAGPGSQRDDLDNQWHGAPS